MRPSAGAEIVYRKGLRQAVAWWAMRVSQAVGPLLAGSVDVRTDAKETALEKSIRLSSRPANDAVGVRREIRDAIGKLKGEAQGFGKAQNRLIQTVAGKVNANNAFEFERVIGVNVDQLGASVAGALEDFRAENVDLITSIPETMLDQVLEVLEQNWNKGLRVEQLSDAIQERFSVSDSRADLIARDQTLKLNAQLGQTRVQAAGITRYMWSTSHDERVRGNPSGLYPNPSATGKTTADHFHLDGQIFEYANPPVVDERTGRRANPGEDYQCRCTAAPLLDFLDESPGGSDE